MTITVFGAKTSVGIHIVKMALAKGYYVKAFDRNIEDLIDEDFRNDHLTAIKGYVFDKDEVHDAIKNSDAIISCLGGSKDGTDKSRSLGMKNIIEGMLKAKVKRIVAISGIGILNYDESRLAIDDEEFPQELKEVSFEHLAAYQHLKSTDLDWTLICPSTIDNKDFTGDYMIKENYLPNQNTEHVNAGDIAHYILKCISKNESIRTRIGISMKQI
ncbi:MAG: NAD(P)H-binding protein [Chitinophagaceae bacterium]|nr:NAD(P)H-binding protein [Chitinophagaceae bacterium]